MTILNKHSTYKYQLLKENGIYYIRRVKDKKTVLIGDKEVSDNFIIYGLSAMKEEINELYRLQAEKEKKQQSKQ